MVISLDGEVLNIQSTAMAPELVEATLLRALAFIQRELLIQRLTQRERGVQVVRTLPRMNP